MFALTISIVLLFSLLTCHGLAAEAPAEVNSGTAHVIALDVASLPYGEYEWVDAQRLIDEGYSALKQNGQIDHGILWRGQFQSGGTAPTGMMLVVFIYGVNREQAQVLLEAAAAVRNVVNPRLLPATVFYPEKLTLPDTGVVSDNGALFEANGVLGYLPLQAPAIEARPVLEEWYLDQTGNQAKVSIGRQQPEHPLSVAFREPFVSKGSYRITAENITPEQKRSINFSTAQSWPTADNSQPWFNGELPILPLLEGHTWVKGYHVNIQRLDAASATTVARLRADALEFAKRVRDVYPGAAVVEDGRGSNLEAPYLLNGHLTQPSLTLLVAVDDEPLLRRIGTELSARAATDAGHRNIMWVSVSSRCIFLDEGATGERQPITNLRRVVRSGIAMVLPLWVDDEQAQAEADNWRDQWIELYRQVNPDASMW